MQPQSGFCSPPPLDPLQAGVGGREGGWGEEGRVKKEKTTRLGVRKPRIKSGYALSQLWDLEVSGIFSESQCPHLSNGLKAADLLGCFN